MKENLTATATLAASILVSDVFPNGMNSPEQAGRFVGFAVELFLMSPDCRAMERARAYQTAVAQGDD